MKSGVPQGSLLWPLCFIIFIVNVTENLMDYASNFADDLKIVGGVNFEEKKGLCKGICQGLID